MSVILDVKQLVIRSDKQSLVQPLSFKVKRGETLALVGESGSGKSLTALALARLLPANLYQSGEIYFADQPVHNLSHHELQHIRGHKIAYVFQEPMVALNPLQNIGRQIAEVLRLHRVVPRNQEALRVRELLAKVGLENIPSTRLPHELSGGQKQRVMIAMSIAASPQLLILDEPTTALDVAVQAQILTLIRQLQQELGMAIVFISHDLKVVKQLADHILVMQKGQCVEYRSSQDFFTAPEQPYSQLLLAAAEGQYPIKAPLESEVCLTGEQLKVAYPQRKSWWRKQNNISYTIQNVSFALRRGETLGIVGESGSGKTTLALALLNLLPFSGRIVVLGHQVDGATAPAWQHLRKNMQLVFQDPFGALSPRMRVIDIVAEGLNVHFPSMTRSQKNERVAEVLQDVGLDIADSMRYAHEFSGGQRQRISLARALILQPSILILDEPTSALDVVLQKKLLELLQDLQHKHQMSYLFISHDLKVIRAMAHQVLVLQKGLVVEHQSSELLFTEPQHAYTQLLLRAAGMLESV